jgi:hypothetical protein
MQIDRRLLEVTMSQQHLDGSKIGASFQQMGGKAVAQGLLVLLMICTQQKFAIGSIPCMASKLM